MDYYDEKSAEHEEMVGGGCILTVVLIWLWSAFTVADAIKGWL